MKKAIKNISLPQLLELCHKHNSAAQKELYSRFLLKVYNVANRIMLDQKKSEDIVQQTFTLVFSKLHQFDESKGNFHSWINKICVNECFKTLRKRKFNVENIDTKLSIASDTPSSLQYLETDYIYKALEKLPDLQRIIFNLYEIEGYAHTEISEQLDINASTSRAYLTRAKSSLRDMLRVKSTGLNEAK